MSSRIAAVVLAAGTVDAERLRELVGRVCLAPVERVAVVLASDFTSALQGLPVHIEANQISPIRAAVAWALRTGCDGLLLIEGDRRISSSHLERLLAAYRGHHDLVGTRGAHGLEVPAIFHGSHYGRLAALRDGHGAHVILNTSPGVTAVDAHDFARAA